MMPTKGKPCKRFPACLAVKIALKFQTSHLMATSYLPLKLFRDSGDCATYLKDH